MAKLGPKEQGGYDPFSAIASSLTALAEEPAAKPEESRAPMPPEREVRPAPSRTSLRSESSPAAIVQPARRPIQPSTTEEPDSHDTEIMQRRGEVGGSPIEAQPRSKTVSAGSALRTSKRFKTTRSEAARQDHAAVRLGSKLGISIDFSKVTRALWEVYLRHEEDILKQIQSDGTWTRPANTDAVGLAELDERLAELIGEGMMIAAMRPRNRR